MVVNISFTRDTRALAITGNGGLGNAVASWAAQRGSWISLLSILVRRNKHPGVLRISLSFVRSLRGMLKME